MNCPSCQHGASKVLDSRASKEGIRRRRQCQKCDCRFTTHERIERKLPLVVKKNGQRAQFDHEKILAGLTLACRKRPVSADALEAAALRVEQSMLARSEVSSTEIGRAVMAELEQLDHVAYLRFASVYLEIGSVGDFLDLIRTQLQLQPTSEHPSSSPSDPPA